MDFSTSDLCDAHPAGLVVAEPVFADFGGVPRFGGPIKTLKVFEDNALVRATLETAGDGRVLVVDGGGSLRRALVGDVLAGIAVDNGWAGILVNACVRDSRALRSLPIGIRALATNPQRSGKRGTGEADLPVTFAGVTFRPEEWIYADEDGIVVTPLPIHT